MKTIRRKVECKGFWRQVTFKNVSNKSLRTENQENKNKETHEKVVIGIYLKKYEN